MTKRAGATATVCASQRPPLVSECKDLSLNPRPWYARVYPIRLGSPRMATVLVLTDDKPRDKEE